jgi:hypothetical protein
MKPNAIEKDTRKSEGVTFFGVPCPTNRYCCVARDERNGVVFGHHACDLHLAPLLREATRSFTLQSYDLQLDALAESEAKDASALSLLARTPRRGPCTSGAAGGAS